MCGAVTKRGRPIGGCFAGFCVLVGVPPQVLLAPRQSDRGGAERGPSRRDPMSDRTVSRVCRRIDLIGQLGSEQTSQRATGSLKEDGVARFLSRHETGDTGTRRGARDHVGPCIGHDRMLAYLTLHVNIGCVR